MIKDELLKTAKKKRIPCVEALALAKRLKVKPIEIGRTANEMGIKITNCQLGCFGRRR
ncbi:hypothetical protein L6386_06385 [bacterium]|nr:hypothetical protein [bacterium]MCG2676640.1 hypothetical protein [bacterium]MCG2678157.1 hypothetical protein [bacterium]